MPNTIPASILSKHIYDSATDFAIITLDVDGIVSSWNVGAELIFGYSTLEIVGTDLSQIFTPEDRASGEAVIERQVATATGRAIDYRWHMRKDGSRFWADGVLTPIRHSNADIIGFLKILRDITEKKQAQDEVAHLSATDTLTGLANRGSFDARTKDLIALCGRSGQVLQLLLIDLDRFKEVNDTFGHQTGDALLRQVAHRLRNLIRSSDFLARIGGDEFGLLLVGPSHRTSTAALASKIVVAIAAPFSINSVDVRIGASIGIASSPDDSREASDLLRKADLALYKVKSAGRDGYHYFTDELNRAAHKKSADGEELRLAVQKQNLFIEYQPIIDSDSGRTIAMEALIRFAGPILSPYPVDYVITLAQELGLICAIGKWVFNEACLQLMQWKHAGLSGLRVCINTCAQELLNEDYITSIHATIVKSGVAPSDVEIELTERDAIDLKGTSSGVLDALTKAGFTLALDDFGTGFSSLSYLRTLPVSTLKLDRSFLFDVPSDRSANAVAKSVIALAADLKLNVVAEGVEVEAQARFLKNIDCAAFQGILFSKAMAPPAATQWLLDDHRLDGNVRQFLDELYRADADS